jgi:hypothetical protein
MLRFNVIKSCWLVVNTKSHLKRGAWTIPHNQMSVTTYRELWITLNQVQLSPPVTQQLVGNNFKDVFSSVFHYFRDGSHPKIMNLRDLNESDLAYLVTQGICPDYLLRNLEKTIRGGYRDPLAFQLTAINAKAVYAVCPFTGRLLTSCHSLLANINVIFYRFESIQVFYVIIAGVEGFKKNAIYFPQQELVVTTGKSWTFEEEDLIELQTRMVCNFNACYRYLSNYKISDKRLAVCIGFFHFAHHLWNELSGIDRLVRKRMIDSIDKFLVLREPLGDIRQIYPEIPADKVKHKTTIDAMFNDIVTNNYFVVRVGDYYITSDTVTRVYEVAKTNCRPETIDKMQHARRRHSPLLWIGIRVGSRTWVNQVDGLVRLIDALHTEFPGLGVVFDGFSLPADRSDESSDNQEYDDILWQENRVVSDIVERLKQHHRQTPGIFNIVGSSIYDANVWAHAIDVYVAPYGTLQHKVGWFANKPGLIHANTAVLDNQAKYIWAAVENPIKPRYVGRAAVIDVENSNKTDIYREVSDFEESGPGILAAKTRVEGDPEFANYELDWQMLYGDLIDLIRSPKILCKLDREIVVNRCKREVKRILHIITNTVDPAKL